MMRVLLLLLSCLADYETVRDLAHGAYTAGLVNMSVLYCTGAIFALRRWKLFPG